MFLSYVDMLLKYVACPQTKDAGVFGDLEGRCKYTE